MFKTASTACAIATVTVASFLAQPSFADRSQLELQAASALREFDFDNVDVSQLSTAQLASIFSIANSPKPHGTKRGLIRSAVGDGLLSSLLRR
ncbi:hypothetical protein AADZ90_021940 [Aestuariibius sp. 2305UL40-4]|uniref:hypothetical protein n=1 Tax=Aestuariibius violaceus TaxID=3234132 RepID=UPI00345F064A